MKMFAECLPSLNVVLKKDDEKKEWEK
jgi:hypothetical protein